jgi:alpha-ketoglutarate-dependent taurine dioxygenase
MINNNNFGLMLTNHPSSYDANKLRLLLTKHGVICFRGAELTDRDLCNTMIKIGNLQNFIAQQAPVSSVDYLNPKIVNLHNEDFLGEYRMRWHMDQSSILTNYLPVRSLYCTVVNSVNITEFADIKVLTDIILKKYPTLEHAKARYLQISNKGEQSFTVRNLLSYCEHVDKNLLRYDHRLELIDNSASNDFKEYCDFLLDSTQIPKFSVEWKPYDFVIFDNNQAPHRRSIMNGICKLKRLTSHFWINQ